MPLQKQKLIMANLTDLLALVALFYISALSLPTHGEPNTQSLIYPDLATSSESIEGIIPDGWIIEMKSHGDLNGDGIEDAAIVLQKKSQSNKLQSANGTKGNEHGEIPRILAILLKNKKDGEFHLVANDHHLIPINSGRFLGDFLNEITITRNSLAVNLTFDYSGSSDLTNHKFVFEYVDGCLRLIGYDESYIQRRTHDYFDVSINYLTGKARTSREQGESGPKKVKWTKAPSKRRLCIQDIGDASAFESGIAYPFQ